MPLTSLSVAVGVINHILSWTPISCFIRSKLVLRHANTIKHDVKITTVSVVPYNLLGPSIFYSCRVFGVERMNFIIAATGFYGLALSLVWSWVINHLSRTLVELVSELSIACRELSLLPLPMFFTKIEFLPYWNAIHTLTNLLLSYQSHFVANSTEKR